ncbi:DUF4365 domain-containing protein [Azospirillum sp.]|uniref:DUF4365 domain-containing protein n=1 Tax=Azospirillum sp. TaxID=34012 RepID=UPI002D5014EE|nr:DUF4365 domain-containing protein [Azospirillum sp.]HYD67728.1 DUF4365 domain-containing protein [Azospirillum sp.]
MLSPNQRRSRFSLAYIQAVAAVAGYQVCEPPVDEESIDGTLMGREGRRPRLDFQAKSTGQNVLGTDTVAFPLSIKNYDDLRGDCLVPRILIVVVMPENESDWVVHSEQELALRHCGYWMSLCGMPSTDNLTSVTVHLPRLQTFDSASLRDIMTLVDRRQFP